MVYADAPRKPGVREIWTGNIVGLVLPEIIPRKQDVGIREYSFKRRKGTGGMLKASWSDFR